MKPWIAVVAALLAPAYGLAAPKLVVIEHFADGHEEIVGPFVASGTENGSPVLTYSKDGFFITRHADSGSSAGPDVEEFLFTTSDCSGPKYVAPLPAPYRFIFTTWGTSSTNSGAYVRSVTPVDVTIRASGPVQAHPGWFCSPRSPENVRAWEVGFGLAAGVYYWPYRWVRDEGLSSLRVEYR